MPYYPPSGGGGGGIIVQDEGTPLGTTGTVNFTGAGVTAAGVNPTTVTISGGGGGGGGNVVNAILDFGTSFTDKAVTVVTGQAWVVAGSSIVAQVLTATGVDTDEMYLLGMRAEISALVPGVGFTVTLYSQPEARGAYTVACIGA